MNTNNINKYLSKVITKILKNPLIFVSEVDVQKLVMFELMKIPELNPRSLYNTNCSIGKSKSGVSSNKYKTMLMHSEYGHSNIKKARSDVVILNQADVSKIDNPLDLKVGGKWLQPDYIFEFGTEKSASSSTVFAKHLKNDFKKISNSKKLGYLIHIQRNYHKSDKGRHEKNIKKFEDYLIEFKSEISSYKKKNIKVIVAIVDVGSDGRIVRGKVRLIKNPFDVEPKFTPINLNSINTEITNLLK